MSELLLPRSTRKFIRREKDRIRSQFFGDLSKQEAMIAQLYQKFLSNRQTGKPREKKEVDQPAETVAGKKVIAKTKS